MCFIGLAMFGCLVMLLILICFLVDAGVFLPKKSSDSDDGFQYRR